MPTVPQYTQRQVQTNDLQGARATTSAPLEAFGGGAASEGVTQAQGKLFDVLKDVQAKADDLRVTDFKTKLTQMQNNLIYGDGGLMSKRGQDALAAPDEFGQKWTAGATDLIGSLANDQQREAAKSIARQAFVGFDGDVKKHVFGESQKLADDTIKAGVSTAQNDAVLNYHDPGKVTQAIETQRQLIQKNVFGMSPEQLEAVEKSTISQTHSAVIQRMLSNGEDSGAKAYFDANKDQISGDQIAHVEKALEEGTTRGQSQRLSDEIMAKRLTMSQAIEQTKAIDDPKLRDATLDRVRQNYQLQEAARRDADEKMSLNAVNIIDQTGDFNKIPPGDIAQMPLSTRQALKNYANRKIEGADIPTDPNTYYNLMNQSSDPATRTKFIQTDLTQYIGKLSQGDWKRMVDIQASLRKSDGKAEQQLDGYRSNAQIINDTLASNGFNTKAKPGSPQIKQVNQFRAMVDAEMAKAAQAKGKPLTNDEVQSISDGLMIKGVTSKGMIFDTKKNLFMTTPDDKSFDVDPREIPARDRQLIELGLRARGITVTDDRIKSIYQQRLNKMVNRGG